MRPRRGGGQLQP